MIANFLNQKIITYGKIFFFILIAFLVLRFCNKIIENRRYDRDKIVTYIKKIYPKSEISFQNIIIIDNDLKYSGGRTSSYYYEQANTYISNGKLRLEPNYSLFYVLFPILIVICVSYPRIKNIRLLELKKGDNKLISLLCLGLTLILLLATLIPFPPSKYYFDKYKNPYSFKNDVETILDTTKIQRFKVEGTK